MTTVLLDYPHRKGGNCGSGAIRDLLDWAKLGWGGAPGEGLVFALSGALDFTYMRSANRTSSSAWRPHRRSASADGRRLMLAADRVLRGILPDYGLGPWVELSRGCSVDDTIDTISLLAQSAGGTIAHPLLAAQKDVS